MHFSTLLPTVRVALLRSSWRSCFMRAALFIMRATNSSLVFTFFFVHFAFHPSPQTKIGSVRANFKQLYLHTHWKLDTCLYELIYSEQSILPPPKIFTNSSCVYIYMYTHIYIYVITIIIIYLSWGWATCWPVPVSRIQKFLQKSAMIPSASWGIAFHYPG